MAEVLLVLGTALAGGLGAVLRQLCDSGVQRLLAGRRADGYPWGIVAVNVLGSAVLGVLTGLASSGDGPSSGTVLVLGVGLLGGYTTLSSSVLHSLEVGQDGGWRQGALHAVLTWALSVAAAVLGLLLAG